jgi:hypothetical protein
VSSPGLLFQVRRPLSTGTTRCHASPPPTISYCNVKYITHCSIQIVSFVFVDSAHTIATRQVYLDLATSARLGLHILHRGWPASCLFLDLSPASVVSKARAITSQATTLAKKGRQVLPSLSLLHNFRKFYFLTLLSDSFHSHIYPVVHIVPSWLTRTFFLALPFSSPLARVAQPPFSRNGHPSSNH